MCPDKHVQVDMRQQQQFETTTTTTAGMCFTYSICYWNAALSSFIHLLCTFAPQSALHILFFLLARNSHVCSRLCMCVCECCGFHDCAGWVLPGSLMLLFAHCVWGWNACGNNHKWVGLRAWVSMCLCECKRERAYVCVCA